MDPVDVLVCTRCGREYGPEEVEYTCPHHDGVRGVLDVRYDYEGRAPATPEAAEDLWTFSSALPVETGGDEAGDPDPAPVGAGDPGQVPEGPGGPDPVSLGAGGTPLLEAETLSDRLGVETLVKDETGNPTGSNKDRASAVVVTRARDLGYDVVTCASTGNAAASLAGYAARAGLDCRIFVPADVPDAKAVQPRSYGASVLAVEGSYGAAYDLCRTVADDRGWYNCNAAMNPYALEGMRTLGFELALGAPDADWVAMPMGNGCSLAAVWKGLAEFERRGHLEDPPRLLGVQAAGTAPIYERFVAGSEASDGDSGPARAGGDVTADGGPAREESQGDRTTADSIDVDEPHNARRACRALEESGGDAVVVSDESILAAQTLLGETEGVFVEPASAAAVAGVRSAREAGRIGPDDRVVVVATGTGLKDTDTASRGAPETIAVGTDSADVPETF